MDISGRPRTGRPKKGAYHEGRKKQINIRLSEKDLARIDKLSKFYGLTRTDLILLLVDDAYKKMRKDKENDCL